MRGNKGRLLVLLFSKICEESYSWFQVVSIAVVRCSFKSDTTACPGSVSDRGCEPLSCAQGWCGCCYRNGNELYLVSSGDRLLFASTTPEFIQQYFILSPLWISPSHLPLSVQAVSTKILLCKLNRNGEKGNEA